MTWFEKGAVAYFMILILLIVFALVSGCEPLHRGDSRKITAWGIWAAPMGTPIGVGYWHSERGPSENIKSEQSAKPELPKGTVP